MGLILVAIRIALALLAIHLLATRTTGKEEMICSDPWVAQIRPVSMTLLVVT